MSDRQTSAGGDQSLLSYHEVMNDLQEDVVQPDPEDEVGQEGLRFDDPYWDDAFCAWWDPALRTCCS